MTDKQIACAYLAQRLWGLIPDHHDLRGIADVRITEERCCRIVEMIGSMADEMRKPLLQHLGNANIDAT